MDVNNNPMNTAVNGVKRGLDELERNAGEVARASKGNGDDVVAPLVDSKLNQLHVEANVEMIKSVDQALGSLFDEKA